MIGPREVLVKEDALEQAVGRVDVDGGELFGSRSVFELAFLSYRVGGLSWCSMARLDIDLTVSDTVPGPLQPLIPSKHGCDSGSDTVSPCGDAVADTVGAGAKAAL